MTTACANSTVPLDHVMFYGGFEMEDLFEFFERAGFFLTPISKHSLGTVNRLAMLEDQYIEMIGFLPGTPKHVRPEIQAMPLGLNGLAAADLSRHGREWSAEHFAASIPLERAVEIADVKGIAKFTITHVYNPVSDARAFLCRHHTPDLLWVKEWTHHPNTAYSIAELNIPTLKVDGFRKVMDTVFDVTSEGSCGSYRAKNTLIHVLPSPARGSLTVRVRDLDTSLDVLTQSGVDYSIEGKLVKIPLPHRYNSDLIFIQQ